VWADAHQLKQVVVNLVTNARQAVQDAAPPRRLSLRTRHDAPKQRVRIEVADSGPGIPREIRARVFDPFFTTKPDGEGTGLGLALARGIVEGHGGAIAVESSPGRRRAVRHRAAGGHAAGDRRRAGRPRRRGARAGQDHPARR
jgi:signal transduction histidine kinase